MNLSELQVDVPDIPPGLSFRAELDECRSEMSRRSLRSQLTEVYETEWRDGATRVSHRWDVACRFNKTEKTGTNRIECVIRIKHIIISKEWHKTA